jgi:hypothetical protein
MIKLIYVNLINTWSLIYEICITPQEKKWKKFKI